MKQVVVTGIGCLSPFGRGREIFAKGLQTGLDTARPLRKFDTQKFRVKIACEIPDFKPSAAFQVLDPFIQYGLTATEEAIQDSGLAIRDMDPYRVSVTVSSSKGGITTLEKFKERFVKKPSAILGARVYANLIPNILSQWIARKWKLKGPAKPVVAACATGTFALMEGVRIIEDDEADVCIAGASDASLTPLLFAGYQQLGVLSPTGIRPFDQRRNGFVIGEGAAVVLLEDEAHAKARGAKIYGKIRGYVYGNESKDIISFPPESDGLARALTQWMKNCGIEVKDIDHLQLHGTGTKTGDLYESVQIKKAFGRAAEQIAMSSIKSMIGHTIGAAGAFSFVSTLLSLRDQIVPPTIHLDKPDSGCDLDFTPNQAKKKTIKTAGSLSMGFGGHIAAIMVSL